MTKSRAAKTGLATVLFLAFVGWIFNLAGPSSPTSSPLLSAQQATTTNFTLPPGVSGKTSPATRVTYTVVKEEVYDAPVKTQIQQHIAVSGVPTEVGLRAEILKRYRSAKARRGFRYHSQATNIYVYVYGTKEQARAEGIRWIGMLAMSKGDKGEPRVVIDEGRLAALSQKPEVRFGLFEQERKKVFRETAAAEERAWREAEARVPDPILNEIAAAQREKAGGAIARGPGSPIMKQYMKQYMKQTNLAHKLQEKYRAAIARKHSLTDEQLLELSVEGVTKGWVD